MFYILFEAGLELTVIGKYFCFISIFSILLIDSNPRLLDFHYLVAVILTYFLLNSSTILIRVAFLGSKCYSNLSSTPIILGQPLQFLMSC